MARNSGNGLGNGSDERTPSNDGTGQYPRGMNGVTARGDGFRSALTVYGNGAQDMLTNVQGPITANSGTMEYFGNLMDQKSRLAELSNSLLQGPRQQTRTLAEIDAAMRADQRNMEYDSQNKEWQYKSDKLTNGSDFIDVAAEALTTTIALDKGLRAITKAGGDEEMAYDPKKYKELYDAKVATAKASGIDIDAMPLEQALPLMQQWNTEAYEGAKGSHKGFGDNPFLYVADQLAGALEVLPGLKQLRQSNMATAEQDRITAQNGVTPDIARKVGIEVGKQQRLLADLYGAGSPAADRELKIYFDNLDTTLRIHQGITSGDWLGLGGGSVRDWMGGSPVDITDPSVVDGRKSVVSRQDGYVPGNFGPSSYRDMFALIEEGESSMYKDRWNAFNRGAGGDSLKVETRADGTTYKRVIQADEIWQEKLTDMSVQEVFDLQRHVDPNKEELGAAGFFQVTQVLMDEAIKKGVVQPGDMFDQETQIKLGIYSISEKRAAVKAYLESDNPTSEMARLAAFEMSKEYESFANPDTGLSFYKTANGESKGAKIASIDVMRALESTRRGLKADAYVTKKLNENKNLNVAQRILNPATSPTIGGNESIRMETTSIEDGKGNKQYLAYPTIMPKANYKRNPNDMPEGEHDYQRSVDNNTLYDYGKDAADEAIKRGEFFSFDNPQEAAWFKANYRRLWGGSIDLGKYKAWADGGIR